MNDQIQKVLYYIETHLDDSLDLETLARISYCSKYHFCRLFKASVNESVFSYIKRLRLEKATIQVIDTKKSIINIALDVGYDTPNGFNKAFKKLFGMTPTKYKAVRISQLKFYKDKIMETPKLVEREITHIVFHRELGGYETSSQIAWNKLSKELNELGEKLKDINNLENIILNPKNSENIGICHDDPSVTEKENIRYDAAIAWGKNEIDFLKNQGLQTKEIPSGQYATISFKGNYKKAMDSWMALYSWITENNYECRDYPPFEKYINMNEAKSEEEILTEIYVPVK